MTLARMILAPALLMSVPALGPLLPVSASATGQVSARPCRAAPQAQSGPGFALLADDVPQGEAICG